VRNKTRKGASEVGARWRKKDLGKSIIQKENTAWSVIVESNGSRSELQGHEGRRVGGEDTCRRSVLRRIKVKGKACKET